MASPYIKQVHLEAEMGALLKEKSAVVVVFHAAWSAPCRGIAPLYSRLAGTHRGLTFVKVEIDTDNIQFVAQKCRITALPTFILIKSENEVARVRGADRKGLENMIVNHAPEAEANAGDSGSAEAIAAGDESLLEFLDMRKVNCLNEAQDHPLKSLVEMRTRNTSEAYLESDADEQLLITLPFDHEVKVRSVVLHTKDPNFGPKKIKIDINKLALGFDDVESAAEPAVVQVLEVPEEVVKEGKPIHLRFVRLQRVNSLHIFVESNHGNEDVTRIDAIDVYGPIHGEPLATTQINGLRNFLGTHRRGMELLRRFRREGGPQNLSNAVALIRESALLCPAGDEDRGMLVGNLAVALGSQYQHGGDVADLSEAIILFYEMLELHPPGHPQHAAILSNISVSLNSRYECEGKISDLEEAIKCQRTALNLRPPGHPDRTSSLDNLSTALIHRYQREGSLSDLEEAIRMLREALDLDPPGHPKRALSLNNLSGALCIRYQREGSLPDLKEAIDIQREALELLPPGHPDRARSLSNLANALLTRYQREGPLSDLQDAIDTQREALSIRPSGHPDTAGSLDSLANALLIRYQREGSISDLRDAIEMQRKALNLDIPGRLGRALSLNTLANALSLQYQREGNLSDLKEAIEMQREALQLRSHDHPDSAASLSNLANALSLQYEREGGPSDLEEAIQMQMEALHLRSLGHPDRADSFNNVAKALGTRYEREGGISDLEEAIEMERKALDFHPPGHPDRDLSLNNLAAVLSRRYERKGSLLDLEEAIEMEREALHLRPPGHPLRASSLNNIAHVLSLRYGREGNRLDLEEAIEVQREALHLRQHGHPNRADSLSNLSDTLSTRYEDEGNISDLKEAFEMHQESLRLHPPGHPNRASSLNDLASTLSLLYEQEGRISDLEDAIEKQRESLDLYPLDHPNRALSLNNFANALLLRYERENNRSDLEEATEMRVKALEFHPPGHPNRSNSLISLSRMYLLAIKRKEGDSTMHDHRLLVDKVFTMLREAVNHSNSPPLHRLKAALKWIDESPALAPDSTLDAYSAALDQLDIVLATSNTLARKHSQLSSKELARCKQLGIKAASCAVQQGKMTLAVEFLERGRNLLFAQIGRYRVELEELQKGNAELAKRFSDLSSLLDSAVVSNQPSLEGRTEFEDPIGRHRRVTSDWDQAVNDIRAVPGFENFLRPPRYTTLQAAAAGGPIISIVPDDDQSHALIILQGRETPHYVNLPKASLEELIKLGTDFIQAVECGDEDEADSCITTLLRNLWVRVVGPIADALENKLHLPLYSRIWWCPSSVLSILPLHAAGRYASRDPNQNLPSKYVSSYTSTLQAVLRAQSKSSVRKGESLLIVAQPDTPGQGRLPNTIPEAGIVKTLAEAKLKLKTTSLFSEEGTRSAVLSNMVNHSWIHLTCHGNQNFIDPFDSCFCLYDQPLTLRDIMQSGLPDAKFAFLAACHTATGDVMLLDEGLHLAAGLQFAGFKSVVGTIWEVADIDGPIIAAAFYQTLQQEGDGEDGIDCSGAAYALSKAVKYLRDIGVPISRWIRHIHIGV